jgi:hypothetical protein
MTNVVNTFRVLRVVVLSSCGDNMRTAKFRVEVSLGDGKTETREGGFRHLTRVYPSIGSALSSEWVDFLHDGQ